eukprot:TRINITY_DN743_c1_g1_i1.p1 TRINITY_DN743_c1_g1~~TRINITY_DN743_c1_g1_i1.p1  ORF type:complete len:731 (+),score=227.72 TRINITY_DN743_c1_g1_i1:73-2265(+)
MSRPLSMAFVLALGLARAENAEKTPTEKVIEMLTDLKSEVTKEGEAEAATYGEFKTFCGDTEAAKTESIKSGETGEQELNATLNDKIGQLDLTHHDMMTKKADRETLEKEKKENQVQCNKDLTNFEAQDADLTAGVFGLQAAIEKLKAAEDVAKAPALLQATSLMDANIEHCLKIAEALGLVQEPKHKAISAFLQGKKSDPWLVEAGKEHNKKDYNFQSGDIVSMLNQLLEKFRGEKDEAQKTWVKTEERCATVTKTKSEAIESKSRAIDNAGEDADKLSEEIGETKEDLLMTQKSLKDDRTYLSELKLNCGNRADDWDQRLKARNGELEAIDTALAVLTEKVQGLAAISTSSKAAAPAFIQINKNLLRRGRDKSQKEVAVHSVSRKEEAPILALRESVIRQIAEAGERLKSQRLAMLAVHLQEPSNDLSHGDILTGVKQMIGMLLTKLKEEAISEADQKGSCTTRLNKANFERDHRMSQSNRLDSEVKNLESKRVFLSEEINLLEDSLQKLRSELQEATKIRSEEAEQNKVTIAKSKEGAQAVKEALVSLKAYYSGVAKDAKKHDKKMDAKAAGSFLQTAQTPPDAGFSGSYGGKQGASDGIVAMMEVIESDFEKTAAKTLEAEQKTETEFRAFKSASNEDIAAKETTKSLTEEERDSAVGMQRQRKSDLQRAQSLVDDALVVLASIKPECVDTAESYEMRAAQREGEIEMLKAALCTLDPNDVEEMCH